MEIRSFKLHNLGRFKDIEVNLAPTDDVRGNVTVFIGSNGAGKTSILKALVTSLSWFVARVRSEKGVGNAIPENVIMNGEVSASIDVTLVGESDRIYAWSLVRAVKGRKTPSSSKLNEVTQLAEYYRNLLTEDSNSSLPLIAFYPVERVVLDVPLKIRERHTFLQIDGYDNSLNQGVDFRRFFEWFREREDMENENFSSDALDRILFTITDGNLIPRKVKKKLENKLQDLSYSSKDRQLNAVRTAIDEFMPDFSNLRVRRKPRLHMSIDKRKETLNVLQLSQGEKSLMALVGDIARRLAMMNPSLENPLHGDGIIFIDEVDMHLHPTWQRKIIRHLVETFPHCQFILTTHSPLVISDYRDILVYSLDDGKIREEESQYGEDVNSVLIHTMKTNFRNEEIEKTLNDILDNIQKASSLREVVIIEQRIEEISGILSANNMELIKLNTFLSMKRSMLERLDK